MKPYLIMPFLLIFFLTANLSFAQTAMLANGQLIYKASDMTLLPEDAPAFEGGLEALYTYLQKNLVYPDLSKRQGREGTVILEFEINNNGEISDISVAESVSKEIDGEAIRLVKKMPQWKPAYQNREAQTVKFQLPIVFELRN